MKASSSITGDIGTGKTTLCRALLEQTDKKTFTALLLNPFLSEEDLFRAILQDLGVVSRGEERAAAASRASRSWSTRSTTFCCR